VSDLVSVVIPTYNHAHFLGRALKSVLDQTYTHWEAIVVDNHSSDNTDEVIASFGDPRISVLKIHNNGVIAASRNLGIQNARGAWVAFLDSDDCWYPGKLAAAMRAAAAEGSDVIGNDEKMVNILTGAKQTLHHGPYVPDFYRTMLVEGNRLSPSATTIRRAVLVEHGLGFGGRAEFTTVEDYDLWLNLALVGARFSFVREVLGEYVIHSANSSSGVERHLRNTENLLRHHVFEVQQFERSPERLWRRILPRLAFAQARHFAAGRDFNKATRVALGAFAASLGGSVRYLMARVGKAVTRAFA
jgi:glycosyltransferase involved in cell wall biosynthesis